MPHTPHVRFGGASAEQGARSRTATAEYDAGGKRRDGSHGQRVSDSAAPPDGLAHPLLDVQVLAADDVWRVRLDQLAWAFVALGIVLRLGRYLLNFPFWGDELMLVQNYLDRSYADLLKPLSMEQVAPLGYMAIELTSVKLFGFSEWSLRLFALVSSLVGMVLFRDLAGRLLGKVPMVLAVGIFAVSYYPIRHATECKPYGSDLAAALLLLWLTVRWWQAPTNRWWLAALAVAGPLTVTVSNPTIFVAAGIGLALLPRVWQTRNPRTIAAFCAYGVLTSGTFLVLLKLVTTGQYETTQKFMLDYWREGFPPMNPLSFVAWFASIHAGEMMAYPVGDDRFGSTLTLICFIAGVVIMLKRKERTIAVLVLAPLGLALLAAALRRYPYGGARLSQYYGALACLTVGLGAAGLISLLAQSAARRRVFGGTIAVLLLIGTATLARDMSHPYKRVVDFEHRGFARWFWKENAAEGEVVCVQTDLGQRFYGEVPTEDYLCYQRAYSPVHHDGPRGINIDELPVDRPLRCVSYGLEGVPRDESLFNAWVQRMTSRYEAVGHQTYRVQLNAPKEPPRYGLYDVYEFRAKPGVIAAKSGAAAAAQR